MTGFNERLDRLIAAKGSHVCVGLDPAPGFRPPGGDLLRYLTAVVDATAPHVVAFKPNAAFYEARGRAGLEVLEAVVAHVHDVGDALVILDAKRGDVSHTAEAYAHAAFAVLGADAITVSPYLGRDAIEPFAKDATRGVFVLGRTSNPGAKDFQDLRVERPAGDTTAGTAPLYVEVARRVSEWNTGGNLGLVTGATWPAEIERIREAVGDRLPFLVPGVGAQGGDAHEAARAAADRHGRGFIINSGRAILQASAGTDFAAAAGRAAAALQREIGAALAAPKP